MLKRSSTATDNTVAAILASDAPDTALAITPTDYGRALTGETFHYDYDRLDADTAALAQHAVVSVRKSTQAHVLHVGAALAEVKAAMPHGEFGAWVSAEFSYSDRTAQRYIRAAEVFGDKSDTVSGFIDTAAIHQLAAPSAPPAAVDAAVAAAASGERVTKSDAQALIDKARAQESAQAAQPSRYVVEEPPPRTDIEPVTLYEFSIDQHGHLVERTYAAIARQGDDWIDSDGELIDGDLVGDGCEDGADSAEINTQRAAAAHGTLNEAEHDLREIERVINDATLHRNRLRDSIAALRVAVGGAV